jgi:hypothetical protein
MAVWYAGSTKWSAVSAWAASTAYSAGQLARQLAAPTAGSERVFACIVAGTSGGSEPTWTTTQGAKTTDNTVTWQEVTGKSAVNGDATNTDDWNTVKNTSVALGRIIKRISAASYQICTTAGTCGNGSEPSFSNTAGTTTSDGTAVWTSLGVVGNFSAYAAPFARLNLAAGTGKVTANTDITYVSGSHAESWSANPTYSSTATGSIICVDDAVVPPTTLAYTGSVTSTGANSVSVSSGFWQGIVFNTGTGAVSNGFAAGSSSGARLRRCQVNVLGTAGGNVTLSGGTGGDTEFLQCDITFNSAASGIIFQSYTSVIAGGTIGATGTIPTNLFSITAGVARVRDVDMSNVNTTLVTQGANPSGLISIENCKLNASATKMTQPTGGLNTTTLKVQNCDSGATNYKLYHTSVAAVVQEETSIVRSGGASDGTTPISYNITTSSLCRLGIPYVFEEISQWNDTTGSSKTATIELTTDTALTDADCWLSIEYLGSSSAPLGSIATSRTFLSPSSLTTSSATWGGTAKTFKYKIAVSFTPQMKGPVKARLSIAKPSVTVYADPLMTIT